MTIENTSVLSNMPATMEWRVYKNDSTALSIALVEEDNETPVDLTGWTFTSKVRAYPDDATVLQTLTVQKNENFINLVLNTSALPNICYFDIQGVYAATSQVRTILAGTIYTETDVTR